MKITTNSALIFSWALLIIYSIICIIQEFLGVTPDSTLTGCFFLAFGVAEGGYCAYIHKLKKEKPQTQGDITGYDDAEVLEKDNENESIS